MGIQSIYLLWGICRGGSCFLVVLLLDALGMGLVNGVVFR